jgi:hypothetical protein
MRFYIQPVTKIDGTFQMSDVQRPVFVMVTALGPLIDYYRRCCVLLILRSRITTYLAKFISPLIN